jgi:hypothetical protein
MMKNVNETYRKLGLNNVLASLVTERIVGPDEDLKTRERLHSDENVNEKPKEN